MKKEIQDFCRKAGITEAQFTGKETVGGGLYLRSLTSIPEGFNPTVGGDLDLRSLTSIPEGFNPTVGGDLDLSSLTSIPEGFNPTVGGGLYLPSLTREQRGKVQVRKPEPGFFEDLMHLRKNRLLFWNDGKYVKADGMFTEVISKKGNVYRVKKVHSIKKFYLVTNGKVHAHGETVEQAKADFRFKVLAEKLKNEPILADTIITIQHYRLITGACELGVKEWMDSVFTEPQRKTVVVKGIVASELLPILKKKNAYGLDRFQKLVSF